MAGCRAGPGCSSHTQPVCDSIVVHAARPAGGQAVWPVVAMQATAGQAAAVLFSSNAESNSAGRQQQHHSVTWQSKLRTPDKAAGRCQGDKTGSAVGRLNHIKIECKTDATPCRRTWHRNRGKPFVQNSATRLNPPFRQLGTSETRQRQEAGYVGGSGWGGRAGGSWSYDCPAPEDNAGAQAPARRSVKSLAKVPGAGAHFQHWPSSSCW